VHLEHFLNCHVTLLSVRTGAVSLDHGGRTVHATFVV
jgi:hypothetical protein